MTAFLCNLPLADSASGLGHEHWRCLVACKRASIAVGTDDPALSHVDRDNFASGASHGPAAVPRTRLCSRGSWARLSLRVGLGLTWRVCEIRVTGPWRRRRPGTPIAGTGSLRASIERIRRILACESVDSDFKRHSRAWAGPGRPLLRPFRPSLYCRTRRKIINRFSISMASPDQPSPSFLLGWTTQLRLRAQQTCLQQRPPFLFSYSPAPAAGVDRAAASSPIARRTRRQGPRP